MSENEVDEISNEYTRTIRSIFAVVREYIAERGPGGSERLSRTERRQLAEAIRIQVGEQGIGKAWFTKRLDDYHAEAAATAVRHRAGDLSAQDRRRASERLSGMRFGIESSLHDTGLSLAQRGQVVRGLDAIDRDPHQPMTVFAPLTDHDAIQARWAAVQSENTVLDRRIGTEKPITAHRPPPVDEAQTARGHAENGRPRKRLTHTREGQPTRSVVAPTDRDAVHTSRSRADRPVESSSRRSEQRAEASELAADDAAGERKSREPANPPADAAWVDRLRDSIGDRVVEAEKLGVSKESVAMTVGRDGAVERSALETRNEHLAQQVDTLAGRNERLIAAVKALTAERNQLATQVTEQGRAIEQIQARFDRVTPRLDSLDREHGRDWSAPADRPETTCEQVNGFATAAVESSNGFGATNTHDRDGADR